MTTSEKKSLAARRRKARRAAPRSHSTMVVWACGRSWVLRS